MDADRDTPTNGAGVHAVTEATALMRRAVDLLTASPGWSLSDGELRDAVAQGAGLHARMHAAWLQLVRLLDQRPSAVPGVASDAVAFVYLTDRLRFSAGTARSDVAAARALDPDGGDLPLIGAALAAGEVHRDHVDAAVRAARELPKRLRTLVDPDTGETGMAVADAFLTAQAKAESPKTIEVLGKELLNRLCPDRDTFDPDAAERRHLRFATDVTGMVRGRFQLDGVSGARLRAAIDLYAKPDPAGTAEDADGQQVLIRDSRSRDQRQADALSAIVADALAHRGDPAAPAPAFVAVTATAEQVAHAMATTGRTVTANTRTANTATCTATDTATATEPVPGQGLASGPHGPIPQWLLARFACDGVLQRVLLAPSGGVLDVGRTQRLATPAQRRALIARDRGCCIPGCAAPASACESHHVTYWRDGGKTSLDNLTLICGRHHTAVHKGHWGLKITDGVCWATPPPWIDPGRVPRRNTTHLHTQTAQRIGQQLRLLLDDP